MPIEFDEQLQRRLRAFQQHHGLTGSGVADAQTWTKLVAAPTTPAAPGNRAAQRNKVIPLSDYPHLHAIVTAGSSAEWLASLGIGQGDGEVPV